MAALFVATEDDDWFGAGVDVVEEVLGAGEVVGSSAEIAAEEGGGPGWGVCWRHDVAGSCVAMI